MNPSLTVLIPTYKRAEIVRETLEAMCWVDRRGLSVRFVVIENGVRDHTQAVVEGFASRLPIRYLYEARPGKNNALNKAINEVDLGEIVVCTDDDVVPNPDWLTQIVETTGRWPGHDVFGGAIYSIWPDGQPPKWWGAGPQGAGWNLGGHGQDIGSQECVYPSHRAPCGPNLWMRRRVLDRGYRFDGLIGPNAKINVMGDEGAFLHMLRHEGYEFVYSPHAVVGHRIQQELLLPAGIRRRVVSQARGSVRVYGLPREQLLRRPLLWCGVRLGSLAWAVARYLNPATYVSGAAGFAARLEAMGDIAYNVEALRMFRESARLPRTTKAAAGEQLASGDERIGV